MQIYPNPASDWLLIDGLSSDAQLQMVDQQGRVVWQQQLPQGTNRVELPALSAGIYWLRAKTAEGQAVRKLLID